MTEKHRWFIKHWNEDTIRIYRGTFIQGRIVRDQVWWTADQAWHSSNQIMDDLFRGKAWLTEISAFEAAMHIPIVAFEGCDCLRSAPRLVSKFEITPRV